MTRDIILASASPRRGQLLAQIGLKYKAVPSDYEEDMSLPLDPPALVRHLATQKAQAVARTYPDAIVIGADSIVVADNKVLGKPRSAADARRTLQLLSGRSNTALTGLCVMCQATGQTRTAVSQATVCFRTLSKADIDDYVASGEPLDKAGSYAIQGRAAVFINRIDGDYYAIVGLPLATLWQLLQEIGQRPSFNFH